MRANEKLLLACYIQRVSLHWKTTAHLWYLRGSFFLNMLFLFLAHYESSTNGSKYGISYESERDQK